MSKDREPKTQKIEFYVPLNEVSDAVELIRTHFPSATFPLSVETFRAINNHYVERAKNVATREVSFNELLGALNQIEEVTEKRKTSVRNGLAHNGMLSGGNSSPRIISQENVEMLLSLTETDVSTMPDLSLQTLVYIQEALLAVLTA